MYGQDIVTAGLFGDANLVAYYKLEDANDSKNTYNLTNDNTATFTTGKYNNGVSFGTGNTNKALWTSNTMGIDGGAITISLWAKILSNPSTGSFFDLAVQANNDSKVYFLIRYYCDASGVFRVHINRTMYSVGSHNVEKIVTLGTSDFHHLALTYNGTTLTGYVNGYSIGSISASGNGSGWGTGEGFSLGFELVQASRYASALLDDVAVFSRALTAVEIANIGRTGVKKVIAIDNKVEATGGTITYDGLYTIHTFTSSGTFTPKHSGNVSALLVAGGGGGGSSYGGGGGGGGIVQASSIAVTPQAYTVTIGDGGTGGVFDGARVGSNGGNSTFGGQTATGGGGGGCGNPQSNADGGQNGGSGGGEGGWIPSTNSTNPPNSSGSQGYGGGAGAGTGTKAGGGGGGGGGTGASGGASSAGNGGVGLISTISGTSTYYSGGGGGGADSGLTLGSGGSGGGGNGGSATWPSAVAGSAGTANTGGGGGAGSQIANGGLGGKGIVIVKYLSAPVSTDIKKIAGVSNI